MKTKTPIIAVAAILTALVVPSIASAQAIFLPSSYAWNQMETTSVPADAHASVSKPMRHSRLGTAVRSYGQW